MNRRNIPLELYAGPTSVFAVYAVVGIGAGMFTPAELGIACYSGGVDIASLRGLDAFRAAEEELTTRLTELDKEAEGQPFNDEQRAEFEEISAAIDAPTPGLLAQVRATIEELAIRDAKIRNAVAAGGRGVEGPERVYSPFNVVKAPENVYDMAAYRQRASSLDDLPALYRDGAMRVIEKATFPTSRDQDRDRSHVAALLAKHKDEANGRISRHIIGTHDPIYQEAWAQYVAKGPDALDGRRKAALQTYTGADGGYAIPFTIDPTFILTNAGAANPFRQNNPKTGLPLARIETIVTKAWQPISTAGVTASYAATEVTAPSVTAISDLTDLTVTPVRGQAWVPFTAEYSEDYGPAAIASELGRMIGDAKDVLEADKLVNGAVGGTVEPVGIYTVLLATMPATGHATGRCMNVATFNLNGLDDQEGMLGARWRNSGRAAHIAALTTLQDYRQLGAAGQPSNSIYDPLSQTLHGYPAFEASYMPTWDTADETGYDIFGDFQQFVIVDRLGLYTQFWPYVVDTNGVPLGQNGIYARWRTGSKVIVPEAFVMAVRDAD